MRTCRCRPGRRSSRPRWGASTSSSAWSTPCSPSRVLIALVGNVNTLMLSVLERTREIGLLRAVGMRRPQVRSESVILAAFGALIGIVVGTLMGLALVSSLRQQGISETTVPVTKLVLFLLLAALLGLVAVGWPARRAARLDGLAPIPAQGSGGAAVSLAGSCPGRSV